MAPPICRTSAERRSSSIWISSPTSKRMRAIADTVIDSTGTAFNLASEEQLRTRIKFYDYGVFSVLFERGISRETGIAGSSLLGGEGDDRVSLQTLMQFPTPGRQHYRPCEATPNPMASALAGDGVVWKLRNHLKWSRRTSERFSYLVYECRRRVAKKFRALANVNDAVWLESHQPRAGRVGSHRVVRKHDLSQRTRGAVERTVPLHCHNPVGDDEANGNRRAKIEDALLNALPVENVLRPSVSFVWEDHAEVTANGTCGAVVALDRNIVPNQALRYQRLLYTRSEQEFGFNFRLVLFELGVGYAK